MTKCSGGRCVGSYAELPAPAGILKGPVIRPRQQQSIYRSSDCLPVRDGRSGTLAGALSGDRPCLTTDLCARGCYGAAAVLVGLVWQAGRFSGTAPLLRDV